MARNCKIYPISPQIIVKKVTAEGSGGGEYSPLRLAINISMREKSAAANEAKWYNNKDYMSNLRIRAVACFSSKNAPYYDFITQRFNEYLNKEGMFTDLSDGQLKFMPQRDFIQKIDKVFSTHGLQTRTTQEDNGRYILRTEPAPLEGINFASDWYSPYEIESPQQTFRDKAHNYPTMSALRFANGQDPDIIRDIPHPLGDTVLYDASVNELVGKNPFSRKVAEVYAGGTPEERTLVLEDVSLSDIVLDIGGGVTGPQVVTNPFSHLSIYIFAYLDYEKVATARGIPPADQRRQRSIGKNAVQYKNAFVTGMGRTVQVTPVGIKNIYPPLSSVQSFENSTGMDMIAANQISSPDARKMDIISTKMSEITTTGAGLYGDYHSPVKATSLNSSVAKIIKNQNYFTPMWLTRNEEDNASYCFGVDKKNIFMAKAVFPALYQDNRGNAQSDLLGGFSYNGVNYRSRILNITTKKRFMERTASGNNSVSLTDSGPARIVPTSTYPVSTTPTPQKINLSLPRVASQKSGIEYYQGGDDYSSNMVNQSPGKYQYGVDLLLEDVSLVYVKSRTSMLRQHLSAVGEVLDILGVAGPRIINRKTGLLIEQLKTIKMKGGLNAESIFLTALGSYVENLRIFGIDVNSKVVPHTEKEMDNPLTAGRVYGKLEKDLSDVVSWYPNVASLINIKRSIGSLLGQIEDILLSREVQKLKPSLAVSQIGGVQTSPDNNFNFIECGHYFDETFICGQNNNFGYDYAPSSAWIYKHQIPPVPLWSTQSAQNRQGLLRVDTDAFQKRVRREFYKYFFQPATGNGSPPPDLDTTSFESSLWNTLTPRFIRTPGGQTLDQFRYANLSEDRGAPLGTTEYNYDEYAELLCQIIDFNSKAEYLNRSFYQAPESSGKNGDALNTKVNQQLKVKSACDVTPGHFEEFSTPERSGELEVITGLSQEQIQGIQRQVFGNRMFPDILGGITLNESRQSESVQSLEDAGARRERLTSEYKDATGSGPPFEATNLLFAIFGELSVDPSLEIYTYPPLPSSPTYQQDVFNSMTQTAERLGLLGDPEIKIRLEEEYAHLPAQIKSMILIAASNSNFGLGGPGSTVGTWQPKRPTLTTPVSDGQEHETLGDMPDSNSGLISYKQPSDRLRSGGEEYSYIKDPMKSYSKFLAFWMNYKQLGRIEYLSGFGSTAGGPGTRGEMKLGRPEWTSLTGEVFRSVQLMTAPLLCRIRTLVNEDLGFDPSGPTILEKKEIFELPIYNKYFLLGNQRPELRIP